LELIACTLDTRRRGPERHLFGVRLQISSLRNAKLSLYSIDLGEDILFNPVFDVLVYELHGGVDSPSDALEESSKAGVCRRADTLRHTDVRRRRLGLRFDVKLRHQLPLFR